jgi:hypothetical protein
MTTTEAISNGDFEDGVNDWSSGDADYTEHHTGACSMRLTCNSRSNQTLSTSIPVDDVDSFTFWAKKSSAYSGGLITLTVTYTDASTSEYNGDADDDWSQHDAKSILTAGKTIQNIDIWFGGDSIYGYFDDVSLQYTISSPEPPSNPDDQTQTCLYNIYRSQCFERMLNLKVSQSVDVAVRPVPTREDGEVIDTGTYLLHPIVVSFDTRLTNAEKIIVQALLDDHVHIFLSLTDYEGNEWIFSDGWFEKKDINWEYVTDNDATERPWKCTINLIFESVAYTPAS